MHIHESGGQVQKGVRLRYPEQLLDWTPAMRAKRPAVELPLTEPVMRQPVRWGNVKRYGAGF